MASTGYTAWFKDQFGLHEPRRFAGVKALFEYDNEQHILTSMPPGKKPRHFHVGPFSDPTVAELRGMVASNTAPTDLGGCTFECISADAKSLHTDPENAGAVFQVASQFNCLEMVGPDVRPEDGVSIYGRDKTQGPACAIACPAATVYRNYFWDGRGQAGGSEMQLNTARDLATRVGNPEHDFFIMQNGYLLPSAPKSLAPLAKQLNEDPDMVADALDCLRVGVHWDTEVARSRRAFQTPRHNVCQVFCSAVPVSYSKRTKQADWEPLARLILDGAYEATLAVASLAAAEQGKRVSVFLTAVGGGVFGNRSTWISSAVRRALELHEDWPLDVYMVEYMAPPRRAFASLAKSWARKLEREARAAKQDLRHKHSNEGGTRHHSTKQG